MQFFSKDESFMVTTSDPQLASDLSEDLIEKGFDIQAPERLSQSGRVLVDGASKARIQSAVQQFLKGTGRMGEAIRPTVKIKKVG